jgi:hypothetical protein
MIAVFLTFALSGPLAPKEMGVILAVAVALDAFVVRLVLLPVLLRLGRHHVWYRPLWLNRILPHVHFSHQPGSTRERCVDGACGCTSDHSADQIWTSAPGAVAPVCSAPRIGLTMTGDRTVGVPAPARPRVARMASAAANTTMLVQSLSRSPR